MEVVRVDDVAEDDAPVADDDAPVADDDGFDGAWVPPLPPHPASAPAATISTPAATIGAASAGRPGLRGHRPLSNGDRTRQRLGGRRVGGEERLDRKLGHSDIDRGSERRHRAEERQLAAIGSAQPQPDHHVAGGGQRLVIGLRRRIGIELRVEGTQAGIAGQR